MKKYLNEENYQKTRSKLKVIGTIFIIISIIAIIAGGVLVVLGFTHASNSVFNGITNMQNGADHTGIMVGMNKTFSLTSSGFFIGFIGLALFLISLFILTVASKREIYAFNAQQILPVNKEIIEEMTPTISDSAGMIAKGIKKGLNDDKK